MDIVGIADKLRRQLAADEGWEHTFTEEVTPTEVVMGFAAPDGTPVSLMLSVTE